MAAAPNHFNLRSFLLSTYHKASIWIVSISYPVHNSELKDTKQTHLICFFLETGLHRITCDNFFYDN